MRYIDISEQKEIALEILLRFSSFCEEHNLKYILAYGTLLGAVRHKGFIPWDDDIDVMMPREDYQKLINIFPQDDTYQIMDNTINTRYPKSFAVLNNIKTKKSEKLIRKKFQDTVCINIDIFPVDVLPDILDEQKKLLYSIRKTELELACISYAFGRGRNILSTIKKNLGIFYFRSLESLRIVTLKKIIRKHSTLMQSYNGSSNTMGCLANTGHNGINEFLPAKCFNETISIEFEGYRFKAPKEYDLYLKSIYGDYMKLPPENQRVTIHDNSCYWRD